MSQPTPAAAEAGLIVHANRWSWAGLAVAALAGVSVAAFDIAAIAADQELIARPLQGLLNATTIGLGLASLCVQLGVRIIRHQRRLADRLEALLPEDGTPRLHAVGSGALPPDKVRAFELGRRVERENGGRPVS